MADKDAKVTVGVEGADQAARAADTVASAWTRAGNELATAGRKAGAAITGEFKNIASDAVRTLTALNTISFAKAIESSRQYRIDVTRTAVAAGESVGSLSAKLTDLSKRTLQSEPALLQWSRGVGRLTYDYKSAFQSAASLNDEAVATGKSFEEIGGLYKTFHNTLGVVGDVGSALGKVRAQADLLGTVGGPAAFQDTLESLDSTLSQFASRTEGQRNRLTGLVGILGQGLSPEAGRRVAGTVLGALSSRAVDVSRTVGYDILNRYGEVEDPTKVLRDLQRRISRLSPEQRLFASRNILGAQAGTIFANADFSEGNISRIAGVAPSTSAAAAGAIVTSSQVGQELQVLNQIDRDIRALGDKLAPLQTGFAGIFAGSPVLGGLATAGLGATVNAGIKAGFDGIKTTLLGEGGATAAGGVVKAASGVAAAEEVAAGSLLTFGTALGSLVLPAAAAATAVAGAVEVLKELGEASHKKQGFDTPDIRPGDAVDLRLKAEDAARKGREIRGEGQTKDDALRQEIRGNLENLAKIDRAKGNLDLIKEIDPQLGIEISRRKSLSEALHVARGSGEVTPEFVAAFKDVVTSLSSDVPQNIRAALDDLQLHIVNDSGNPVAVVNANKAGGQGSN